jgi:glycosyltransferase involved in cell wall biosynthesis
MKRKGPSLLVPNALRDDLFEYPVARRTGPVDDPVYVNVSNVFDGRKNTSTLIEAFARVKRSLPKARLILFGNGHGAGGDAEKWAGTRGMTEGVDFRGVVPHDLLIAQMAVEADICVHPAREENCCMAVLEAQALRIPVIAGIGSGGTPWLLDEGLAGYLCDVGSVASLSEAMLQCARSQRGDTIAYTHERGKACFSLTRVANQFSEALAGLARPQH